ncbi:hypothetical protein EXU57_19790 [Segetibacter sp. 3557_3]|uniref:SPW repeat domain-containing protein n=1 Tax=Segetibacter sp. 3557_3 TaxID=2547429 RepID=UPI001058570A|nr:hypothetical protein [Segetibacter sp. 3557_3]TDH21440.1 hypothetical protein EXU57_19790 [Segetibacter sp. 3557_3]
MRIIPTRVHGMLDYLVGVILMSAPWLLGFAHDGGAKTWIPFALGLGALAYSIFTDYELGLVRKLPMATHLMLDLASGILLAISPWLFGFADEVYLPHLLFGIFEIGAAIMTKTVPAEKSASFPGAATSR